MTVYLGLLLNKGLLKKAVYRLNSKRRKVRVYFRQDAFRYYSTATSKITFFGRLHAIAALMTGFGPVSFIGHISDFFSETQHIGAIWSRLPSKVIEMFPLSNQSWY